MTPRLARPARRTSTPKPVTPNAFEPVPGKARHDGWTAERQSAFIAALAATRSVSQACAAVGKSTTTAYALRARAGARSFAAAWDSALAFAADAVPPRSARATQRLKAGARPSPPRLGNPLAGRSKAAEVTETRDPPYRPSLADHLRRLREL